MGKAANKAQARQTVAAHRRPPRPLPRRLPAREQTPGSAAELPHTGRSVRQDCRSASPPATRAGTPAMTGCLARTLGKRFSGSATRRNGTNAGPSGRAGKGRAAARTRSAGSRFPRHIGPVSATRAEGPGAQYEQAGCDPEQNDCRKPRADHANSSIAWAACPPRPSAPSSAEISATRWRSRPKRNCPSRPSSFPRSATSSHSGGPATAAVRGCGAVRDLIPRDAVADERLPLDAVDPAKTNSVQESGKSRKTPPPPTADHARHPDHPGETPRARRAAVVSRCGPNQRTGMP